MVLCMNLLVHREGSLLFLFFFCSCTYLKSFFLFNFRILDLPRTDYLPADYLDTLISKTKCLR